MALVRNNARVGADIAVELTKLRSAPQVVSKESSSSSSNSSKGPLVVGGSIFDFVVRLKEGEVSLIPPPPSNLRYTSMAALIKAPLPPAMEVLVGMWHLLCPGAIIFPHSINILHSLAGSNSAEFYAPLIRLGAGPRLASAVGKDEQGRGLLSGQNLDTSLVINLMLIKRQHKYRSGWLKVPGQLRTLLFLMPRASVNLALETWTSTHRSARIM